MFIEYCCSHSASGTCIGGHEFYLGCSPILTVCTWATSGFRFKGILSRIYKRKLHSFTINLVIVSHKTFKLGIPYQPPPPVKRKVPKTHRIANVLNQIETNEVGKERCLIRQDNTAVISVKISNSLVCFCNFNLCCPILEKDNFIKNLYLLLFLFCLFFVCF